MIVDSLWLLLSTFLWAPPVFGLYEDEDPPAPVPPDDPDPPDDGSGEGSSGGGGGCPTVSSGGRTFISVDQAAHTVEYDLSGSYTGNSNGYKVWRGVKCYNDGSLFYSNYWGGGTQYSTTFYTSTGSTNPDTFAADNQNQSWRAWLRLIEGGCGNILASLVYYKSHAVTATSSAPTVDNISSSGAFVSCNCFPNTNHSTATLQIQYKKTVDSTWLELGDDASTSGYSEVTIARSATGLDASTQYDVRLIVTRTTVNETTHTSTTTSFTTLAGEPTVTTDAASSVTHNAATMNATVDINDGTGVTLTFEYDTDSGAPYANETSGQSVSADGSFSEGISGLTASTTYYARAKLAFSTPTGSPNYGDEINFTTAGDPVAEAADQQHTVVLSNERTFDRKYGVATTVYFVAASPRDTSADKFYTGSAVWGAAGECQISQDGGAFADTTNDPVKVGGQLFSLTLTAAEMQCSEAAIIISDTGGAVRDVFIKVRTQLLLGNIDIDAATGQKANTSALKLSGYGSGHGLEAIGGSTGMDINGLLGEHIIRTATSGSADSPTSSQIELDSSASATNDLYNGTVVLLVSGDGSGQARVITDYDGTTKLATVHKAWATEPTQGSTVFAIIGGTDQMWDTSPGAELDELPTYASPFAKLLQYIYQRVLGSRVVQSVVTRTMYETDGTTSFSVQVVDNDGATEEVGNATDL